MLCARMKFAEEGAMAAYNPELISLMRLVLDEVMTRVPAEQATPGIKAHLAEVHPEGGRAGRDVLRRSCRDG
jgi:hypothetical protein